MKVILLVDDKKLGRKAQIIEVADSYAKNVLFPKQIAIQATNENINKLNNQISKDAYNYQKKVEAAQEAQKLIMNLGQIDIKVEKSNNGKMFGSVTSTDIVETLKKYCIIIKKQDVILSEPIKTLGLYKVVIKLFENITAELMINIKE